MEDDDNEMIRQRAHRIWEDEGRPEGRHDQHWAQARSELQGKDGQAGGDGPAADGKGGQGHDFQDGGDKATGKDPGKAGRQAAAGMPLDADAARPAR